MEEKNEDKVIKLIRLQGEVIDGKTLIDLQDQTGDEYFDTLIIEIASPGGCVAEGLAIMVWLDELSQSGKEIITIVVANAYSIASLIMLAADYRIISKHGEVMVHNPMVPELSYANAEELEKYASELRQLESVMYELYQIFTGLSKEEIKVLMDNETYLSPAEAVKNGFADVVVDIKPKSFQMTTINNKQINMSKTLNILNKVIAMVGKADFVNQLYYTEDGEIEIFQVDPAGYAEGDRTSVESGEFKLADGAKIKVEDFVITEINKEIDSPVIEESAAEGDDKVVEEGKEGDEVVAPIIEKTIAEPLIEEAPKKAKTDMPSKVIETTESVTVTKETVAAKISEILKFEFEVVQESFEVGTLVEYVPFEEGADAIPVGSGEYLLEDGRKILIDSDGIVQMIKDAPAVAPAAEEHGEEVVVEAKAKEDDKPEAKVDDKPEAKEDDKPEAFNEGPAPEQALLNVISEMKVTMKAMEDEIKAIKDDAEAKAKAQTKFEDLAVDAIDKLAENTVSNFKPSARVSVEAPDQKIKITGSIFQKLKKEAGIK